MKQKTKYKETEIGKIPEDWEVKTLSSMINIIGGGTPKTSNKKYWDGNIPWISVVDFVGDKRWIHDTERKITEKGFNESSTKLLTKGQLIISARGTVGELGQVTKNMAFNQSCYGLDSKTDIINDFLYYLLRYKIKDVQSKTHGSVFSTITRETFDQIQVALPEIEEQKTIAKILSGLDSKIELNQQMNKILEAIGQALFKRWFVDFEFPNDEGKPYMSSGGEMVDSELGGIPKRWKIGVITDITEILSGFAFKSSHFVKHGKYKLVTIKNVQDGYFEKNTKNGLEKVPEKMPEYCKLKIGDILLSLTGNVGRICQVTGKNYLLNQRVAKLQPHRNQNHAFVYLFFRQRSILSLLENISSGTAQQNLSPVQTGNIKIVIPNREILDNFRNITNFFYTKILENNIQIQALTKIRDLLLPRLMSGKIRVKI